MLGEWRLLPLGLGGHGLAPLSHPPLPPTASNSSSINPNPADFTATHHHGAFYASCWSASCWSLIRAWVPLLHEQNLPSLSDPITSNSPPYKTQIRDAWLRINASSARLKLHPERNHLPTHHRLPTYFEPLLDGENEPVPEMSSAPQTSSGPSSPSRPCLLIPPNIRSTITLPKESNPQFQLYSQLLPFASYSTQQPIQANRVSSMARHRKAHPRGSLGCPNLTVSVS
jgi:hypothetical protein